MKKTEQVTAVDALLAASEVLRLLGKNLASLSRRAEAIAWKERIEGGDLAQLLKQYQVIQGVAGILTAADLADDDGSEEVNRLFRTIEEVLRCSGMLEEEFAGQDG